jgi:hypothetical protein
MNEYKRYICDGSEVYSDAPCPKCVEIKEQKQIQFHAPLTSHSETYPGWPVESESCVVMSESSARALVTAIDNARHIDAITIIQSQPWYFDVRAGIRATRHLKPTGYIKMSERACQLSPK